MRRNVGRDIQDDQFLDHPLRDENIARSGSGSRKTGSVCLDIQGWPQISCLGQRTVFFTARELSKTLLTIRIAASFLKLTSLSCSSYSLSVVKKLILVRCRTNPHDSWLRVCQLIRRIGRLCASSLPVSMRDFRAWSLRKIAFAVNHAVFVYKNINCANPRVLL
jgi:hypothetical protein